MRMAKWCFAASEVKFVLMALLIQRARAMVPILIPLFVSAFRRADELATSMECRSYRGGEGRTRLRVLKFRVRDALMLFAVVLFGAAIVYCNLKAPGYTM